MKRASQLLLIVLNCVVLLGQLWPEGAPPFARIVNIVFLLLSLVNLLYGMRAPGGGGAQSGRASK